MSGFNFDEESVRRISNAVRKIEAMRVTLGARPAQLRWDEGWKNLKNGASEEIPGFALVRVSSGEEVGHRVALMSGVQPDSENGVYVVNSGRSIRPNAGGGLCKISGPVEVLYEGDTPTPGEQFGAKPGSWAASRDYPPCLMCYSVVDEDAKIMLALLNVIGCPADPAEFVDLTIEGEGSETANTDEWEACNEDGKGCKVKEHTRTVYNHSGDEKLYGFQREWTIAADGRIVSIGPEVRYEIDELEDC